MPRGAADAGRQQTRWHAGAGMTPLQTRRISRHMLAAYGAQAREVGHKTMGHLCVSPEDVAAARQSSSSLLYGEILPEGITKMMHRERLNGRAASSLVDLGAGTGKLVLQCFLQFENLRSVVGVEISPSRYRIGEEAILRLAKAHPRKFRVTYHAPGRGITVAAERLGGRGGGKSGSGRGGAAQAQQQPKLRELVLRCGDMFEQEIASMDVLVIETAMGGDFVERLSNFLSRAKPGSRILSYLDLRRSFADAHLLAGAPTPIPLRQKGINRDLSDRLPTSWNPKGHHFYIWDVMAPRTPRRAKLGIDDEERAATKQRVASDSPAASPSASPVPSPATSTATSTSTSMSVGGKSAMLLPLSLSPSNIPPNMAAAVAGVVDGPRSSPSERLRPPSAAGTIVATNPMHSARERRASAASSVLVDATAAASPSVGAGLNASAGARGKVGAGGGGRRGDATLVDAPRPRVRGRLVVLLQSLFGCVTAPHDAETTTSRVRPPISQRVAVDVRTSARV